MDQKLRGSKRAYQAAVHRTADIIVAPACIEARIVAALASPPDERARALGAGGHGRGRQNASGEAEQLPLIRTLC
jgi:hypothetical protein